MRILDKKNKEITEYSNEEGYLVPETIVVKHHKATPEVPRETELVTYWVDENNPDNKLVKTVVTQEYVPAKEAWDEVENIMRYHEYSATELAEREAQRIATEQAAAEQAVKAARMAALPAEVDALTEGVAELGVLAADATVSNEELMQAVAELGQMIAQLEETAQGVRT